MACCCVASAEDVVPGRLLIKFKPEASLGKRAEVLSALSARKSGRIDALGIDVLSLPSNASPRAVAARAKAMGGVEFAEPDALARDTGLDPNDPYYAGGWQMEVEIMNSSRAWAVTSGSSAVTVAVLDSGIFSSHPDLASKIVPGWNFCDNNSDTSDVRGHGTRAAGIAAAQGNNGIGVAGIAWGCKIMPLRISGSDGIASYSNIAAALTYAVDHGARVCSVSFILNPNSTLKSALQYVDARGGVVCSSSGNDGAYSGQADEPLLITVGGTDEYRNWVPYSNYGDNVDVSAPASGYTTTYSGGYDAWGGTSCATPYVAGAAALALSVNPLLTASQLRQCLLKGVWDIGAPGRDPYYGSGFVNLEAVLTNAKGQPVSDATPPTVSLTNPARGAALSGTAQVWAVASDNNSVDKVCFLIDGVQVAECVAGAYGFTWDTTRTPNGTHTLTAEACDSSGNKATTSISVQVTNFVVDSFAPSVSVVTPTAGDRLGKTAKTTVRTTDNVGVTRVETYLDGRLVASSTSAPFAMTWSTKTVTSGLHSLQCMAYDAAGNCGQSAIISVRK